MDKTIVNANLRLDGIGKRYRQEWIFRHLSLSLDAGESYAVLGPNGSGKSTLVQILSGFLSPSEGQIHYADGWNADNIYKQISLASPYTELIEELTLEESIRFQLKFKPFVEGVDEKLFIEKLELPQGALKRPLRLFSSGMKQRVKLALALCADTDIVLLDEPTITLDKAAIRWYDNLREFCENAKPHRTLVIASNVESDIEHCGSRISILDYKRADTQR